MSKIKIKNFGPIKEGCEENDGFLDVKKVTVFIGNQGSGKSTVAKVISTLTWMEKALNRGDFKSPILMKDFQFYFEYQGLKSYFKEDTIIEYFGDGYAIKYNAKKGINPEIYIANLVEYIVPKIMYVPAERNFLSVINNATGVRGLPEPLFEFAEELKRGQYEVQGKEVPLPINGVKYKYDYQSDASYIVGKDFDINLLVASSGFQSLVPLFLVSKSLAEIILSDPDINPFNISVDRRLRMDNEINEIVRKSNLSNDDRIKQIQEIKSRYQNKAFINIVEEPEQNLYPSSQHQILNSLLEFNNLNKWNKLILTTHSPYLINYLTLAVKAFEVYQKVNQPGFQKPKWLAINEIVPLKSLVRPHELVIYELNENDGTIKKLEDYNGLPSDENKLNNGLGESNELFAQLLEIEQSL